MTDKFGYACLLFGGFLIAFKQGLSEAIWGEWTYPYMMKIQGMGIFFILGGVVLLIMHFTRKPAQTGSTLEHLVALKRAGVISDAEYEEKKSKLKSSEGP